MKQSSIEWLFEQYKLIGMLTTAQVEKAKAMHKEEMIEVFHAGIDLHHFEKSTGIAEEFYVQRFNTKEK